jgi:hypothetical protein
MDAWTCKVKLDKCKWFLVLCAAMFEPSRVGNSGSDFGSPAGFAPDGCGFGCIFSLWVEPKPNPHRIRFGCGFYFSPVGSPGTRKQPIKCSFSPAHYESSLDIFKSPLHLPTLNPIPSWPQTRPNRRTRSRACATLLPNPSGTHIAAAGWQRLGFGLWIPTWRPATSCLCSGPVGHDGRWRVAEREWGRTTREPRLPTHRPARLHPATGAELAQRRFGADVAQRQRDAALPRPHGNVALLRATTSCSRRSDLAATR